MRTLQLREDTSTCPKTPPLEPGPGGPPRAIGSHGVSTATHPPPGRSSLPPLAEMNWGKVVTRIWGIYLHLHQAPTCALSHFTLETALGGRDCHPQFTEEDSEARPVSRLAGVHEPRAQQAPGSVSVSSESVLSALLVTSVVLLGGTRDTSVQPTQLTEGSLSVREEGRE